MRLARKKIVSVLMGTTLVLGGCFSQTPPANTWELAVDSAYDAALSDDGSVAVVASLNHGGSLWQLPAKERVYNWNHKAGEYSLFDQIAISGNGRFGATSEQDRLTLWDATTGKPINFWSLPAHIRSLTLSADGSYLLAGLDNSTALLINTSIGKGVKTFSADDQVSAVALSPDNKLAMLGTRTGKVSLWQVPNGEARGEWSHSNQIQALAISANSQYAFSSAQAGAGVIVDLSSGQIAMNIDINRGGDIAASTYTAARFALDQPLLLTGSSTGKVKLWNISSKQELSAWEATKRDVWKPSGVTLLDVSFTREGQYRAIASNGLAYEFKR